MAEEWFLKGEYLENCNCRVSCPCTMDLQFKPSSADGSCHVTLAYDIAQGRLGSVDLGGLGAVLVLNSPPGQAMADGNLKAAMYLDERASPQQQEALTTIFSGGAGGIFGLLAPLMGEVLGVKPASIRFEQDGKQRRVRVADVTEVAVEPIPSPLDPGQSITLGGMNMFNPGEPLTQAIVRSSSYRDFGLEWDNTGQNGYVTALNLQGP